MTESYSKSIGSLITQTARLHRARTGQVFEKLGLFPGQDAVLETLHHHGPLTIGGLAELLHVRAPTVSKAVTRLASAGLLERREGDDGRRVGVALTKKGRATALKAIDLAANLEEEMLAQLDGRDRRRLRKLLKRIEKTLHGSVDHSDTDEADTEG